MKSIAIIFGATESLEGGCDAPAFGCSTFTQEDDWDNSTAMVRGAVRCHFDFDIDATPRVTRLNPVRNMTAS